MTIADWRDAPAEEVVALLAAERRRFVERLHWDLGPALRLVETGRQRGDVPGYVLRDDDGKAAGWAFYVLAARQLQIGAVHAPTAAGVRELLDAILESPEAELAQSLTCFLQPASPSVRSALMRLRFDLQRHLYLEASIAGLPGMRAATERAGLAPFDPARGAGAVRLLARAYAGEAAAKVFAPNGRLEEWAQYLGQTFSTPAVGRFLPEASFLAGPDVAAPQALVVSTEIARGVAHVAQVAVDPSARRQGLGRRLVLAAAEAAAARDMKRLSLIVAESNMPARALYASLGFVERGEFLAGQRGPVPRRVGGVTFRAIA